MTPRLVANSHMQGTNPLLEFNQSLIIVMSRISLHLLMIPVGDKTYGTHDKQSTRSTLGYDTPLPPAFDPIHRTTNTTRDGIANAARVRGNGDAHTHGQAHTKANRGA